ncbi:MAG: hypothetical protein AB1567_07705 [bacterium]
MEERLTGNSEEMEVEVSEELRRIFEGDESEKGDLICWGYRDYWPLSC